MRLPAVLLGALAVVTAQEAVDPTPKPYELRSPRPLALPTDPPKLKRQVVITLQFEAGGVPSEPAYVEVLCEGGKAISGFTNKKGQIAILFDETRVDRLSHGLPPDCQAQVTLTGYRSVPGQPLVLRPIGAGEGWSVSVTNQNAPAKARKLLASGREAAASARWDAAESAFRAAIADYPEYASAWLQLGILNQKLGRMPAARAAYEKAVALDPKFTVPWVQLVEIAAAESNWTEAGRLLGIVMPLKPLDVPAAYYYDAAYRLRSGDVAGAEQSARTAVAGDPRNSQPNFRRFLAGLLTRQGKDEEALAFLREYLTAVDSPEAKAAVRELEAKLSARR